MQQRSFLIGMWVAALAALPTGCGDSPQPRKISQTQEATVSPGDYHVGATSEQRFGGVPGSGHGQTLPSGTATGGDYYTVPAGWTELPPKQLREINLKPAGHPDAECFLSAGLSRDVAGNVNRWRGQFGLPAIDEAAAAALPAQTLLGTDATLVELEGSFAGMGGAPAKPGFAMVALLADIGDQMVSVKMTGPKDVVAAERKNFDAFVSSIRLPSAGGASGASAADPHGGAPPASTTAGAPSPSHSLPSGGFAEQGIRFTAPSGWTRTEDRPMRIATLVPAGTKETECVISAFPGDAGGVAANVVRWRGQMGLAPLSADEIANLPRVPALGTEAVLVDWRGAFSDSMTKRSISKARFLGAIVIARGRTVFVKLTGPESEVDDKTRDAFLELCGSLKEE